VLEAYATTNGNLLDMIDHVPLSSYEDLERFKEIVEHAILQGLVERKKQFGKINQKELNKRKKRLEREQKQVNQEQKPVEEQLQQMIQKRNQQRQDALLDSLTSKYGSKTKRQAPSEEEFQQLQDKLFKKNKKG
jgi:hypothetical protein